jgi:asparagine synthase (glutamine-hydrolysing)
MGFAVPISQWFRGPLQQRVRGALTGNVLRDTGMFDMDFLETLVDQHQSGVREHSPALWSLLMFDSFLRQVHHGAGSEPSPERPTAGALA